MSRRKNRKQAGAANYMGGPSERAEPITDLSKDDFISLLEKKLRSARPKNDPSDHEDVSVTIRKGKNENQSNRIELRIYNNPPGMELKNGDKAVVLESFDKGKRLYFVPNPGGNKISQKNANGAFTLAVSSRESFFSDLLNAGYEKISRSWELNPILKYPYIDLSDIRLNKEVIQ